MSFQDSILHFQQLADHSLKQGNFVSYINNIQQVYELKRELLGPMNQEIIQLHDKLITQMNHYGIVALQKQDMESALIILKKAEESSSSDKQKVSSFNNLACFYRRIGKLRTALNYLQSALQIELTMPSSTTLSDTYLNMCAVLSQLNKHEDALQHIYLSIIMLQHELLMKTLQSNPANTNNGLSSKSTTIEKDSRADSQSQDSSRLSLYFKPSSLQERVAVLVVAYHNLGVEMEHLKKSLEAKKIYQSALSLAETNLNKNHQMTNILRKLNNDQKENVQSVEKVSLPGLSFTKPKFSIPRTTLSVMNSTRRNPKGLKIFAPQIHLDNSQNEPNKSTSAISHVSPPGRFSPLNYAPKTITLKSISVNSPLEIQQQQSLGRRSMHESYTLG